MSEGSVVGGGGGGRRELSAASTRGVTVREGVGAVNAGTSLDGGGAFGERCGRRAL